ncbi:sulfotransferase family 2 domain-containing protein [Mycobacterium sp. NAZ190054]|uniref:sulfotransferase family 2 domain-containing protein n=1 Tax=Mycobacterium sp. NAZ190054 TaxID=1747766 RepID=UPI0012E342BD|nr:sulfotransferase family 2 domain-containing protein [Mycobacterium sp. NAZ190054]
MKAAISNIGGPKPTRSTGIMYSDMHKLIYCPIPKNATSYLRSVLLRNDPNTQDFDPVAETALEYLTRKKFPAEVATREGTLRERRLLRSGDYTKIVALRDPAKRLVSCFLDKFAKANTRDEAQIERFCQDASSVLGKRITKDDLSFASFAGYVFKVPDWRSDRHYRSQASYLRNIRFDHYFDVSEMTDLLAFLTNRGLNVTLPKTRNPSVDKKTPYSDEDYDYTMKPAKFLTLGELRTMPAFPRYDAFFDDELTGGFEQRYQGDIDLFCSMKNVNRADYLKQLREQQ